jgi:hypothetical protein
MAGTTRTSRPRQATPEQEAAKTKGEWVRNEETGKMEFVPEAEPVINPKPPKKTPRKETVTERTDPQDRPVESSRPKVRKDRSLEGTQEQKEGLDQYKTDKIKQGAGAGERDEQPGSYPISSGKTDQADQQALDKIGSLKEAVEAQEQKDAVQDEKQGRAEEDEKPDDQ